MPSDPERARVLIDRRTTAALLAWVLVFAYSWAPFEASFQAIGVAAPADTVGWPSMGLHFLAFAAAGLLSRAAMCTTGGWLIPSVLVRDLSICLVVELGQLFAGGRHAEIQDLALNAVGIVAGHAMFPTIRGHPWTRDAFRTARNWGLATSRLTILLCAIFWAAALMLPLRNASLADWDLSYPLLLGNEKDGERPWEGEIKYLALYDRSLSPSEIDGLSDLLPPASVHTSARSPMGALAVYDFTEAPLVLEPHSPVTSSPGEPLSRRIAAQGSFSVEVWLKPAVLTQTGPARIVGISESAWRRNFTLGQEAQSIHFRVRNPLNGPNGTVHEFRCDNALTNALSHIVVTYDRGVVSLYREGSRPCPALDLREPSLLLGLGGNPLSHAVTALIAALTFLLSGAAVVELLFIGYAALAVPLVLGGVFGVAPATSLYYWFGPLLVICGYALRVTARVSDSRSASL